MDRVRFGSGKRNLGFLVAISAGVAALIFLAGCGKKDTSPAMETAPSPFQHLAGVEASDKWLSMLNVDPGAAAGVKGKESAQVVAIHPQGQLKEKSQSDEICITFSRPVAPLEQVSPPGRPLIRTQPAIEGEGYFKSSTTYCLVVKEELRPSTTYQVVFEGFESPFGFRVKARQWSFSTPVIKILKTRPRHQEKWRGLEQRVLVKFSQPVNPPEVKPYLRMTVNGREWPHFLVRPSTLEERKALYYWEGHRRDPKKFITLAPTLSFPRSADVRVYFLKDLPADTGNLGLAGERVLDFRTFEDFEVKKVSEEFNPDRGIEVQLSNEVKVANFLNRITVEPRVRIHRDTYYQNEKFRITGAFLPNTRYRLFIPRSIQDIYGNLLPRDYQFTVQSRDYSPYLTVPTDTHFVLESYLPKVLPVQVRNVDLTGVLYQILDEEDLIGLVDGHRLDLEQIKPEDCQRHDWQIPIRHNQHQVLPFNLQDIGIEKEGVYYIKFDQATNYRGKQGAVFQLTDQALIAKYSPSQIFLTAFNLKDGQLQRRQKFNIMGPDFRERIKSGDDGVALVEPRDSVFLSRDLMDFKIFCPEHGSFIWGSKETMFDMWNFSYDYNISFRYSPRSYYHRLLMFTDKDLYKAGQTVKFKGIFRHLVAGELKVPEIGNIEGEVYDSANQKLQTFTVDSGNFAQYGTFAHQFDLPRTSPSGFYRIHLKITQPGEENPYTQDLNFSVQEYKPAKFEVSTDFEQSSAIAGETVSGSINGRYLFGTPMKGARGEYSLRIKNIDYTPPGWDQFTFGTSESATDRTVLQKSLALDATGDFNFQRESVSFDTKNSVRMTLYGEIQDQDNNRISSSTSLVIHRGAYYIGVKTGSYFFSSGTPGTIRVVTVDPEGRQGGDHSLQMLIERLEWKSYQKKDASGSLRWYWERERQRISEEKLAVRNGDATRNQTFDQPGYYEITLTGKDRLDNPVTTTANFYVTGRGYVSWRMDEGRIIDLVTDRKKYRVGDTVELLIKSPFKKSTVLITAEREKVFWYRTVHLEGNANTVKIPVQENFLPNIFFNVILLKERTGLEWDEFGNDIGKPEFYAGYTEVAVDSRTRQLKVEVTPDRMSYGPGEAVTLDLKVTDSAGEPVRSELCISVVDKGVLNLVGYELPDPYRFFYQERPLDVRTVSTLMDVLGRRRFSEKSENPGGGAGLSAFGSVVVRKDFKESAFYHDRVYTDSRGRTQVRFSLPENLTTFVAMAVSVDQNHRFGQGTADLLVKKELVLKPALPDFLRPGDTFRGGVTVTNNTDQTVSVAVRAEVEGLDLAAEGNEKEIRLEAYTTGPVLFDFRVPPGAVAPRFIFRARSASASDGYEQSVPVRMPQFPETVATSGEVTHKRAEEMIRVPSNSIREYDRLEVIWSPSISGGVEKSYRFLKEYPYDCLEQSISKLYPLLSERGFLARLGIMTEPYPERKKRVEKFLLRLGDFQNPDGGFGYYPESRHSGWFLTIFTTDFMLDARQAGYRLDDGLYNRAREYLKKICQNSIDSRYPYSMNMKLLNVAYAAYVLARDGIILQDTVNNLFEMRERMPLEGISYLIRIFEKTGDFPDNMQPVLTRALLNHAKDDPTRTHFENRADPYWWTVHGSSVRTTATVFDTLLLVYQRFPLAPKIARWLFDTLRDRQYLVTQEHLAVIKAFEKYFERYELTDPDYVARIFLQQKEVAGTRVADRRFLGKKTLTLTDYPPDQQIRLKLQKDGKGILYYTARMTYHPRDPLPPVNRGFQVQKTFTDLNGKPVDPGGFVAGEKYIAELKIETTQQRSFVVVDDPLPAGFKVVNPRFETQRDLGSGSMEKRRSFAYWGGFYRGEYYFDRVELFADYLSPGTHTWQYLVIAANRGIYRLPASMALEMYNPEVFGRNADREITIQ